MIDLTQLFPKVRGRNTFASFDPVSGVMFVGLPLEEFSRVASSSDGGESFLADEHSVPLLVSLNHETYHFVQTLCTGYMRDRAQRKHALVTRAVRRWSEQTSPVPGLASRMGLRIVERLLKDSDERSRVDDVVRAMFLANQLRSLDAGGGSTLVGQASPETIAALRVLDVEEAAAGRSGVSTLSVIEGGAMTYQYLLSYGRENAEAKLIEEWDQMPDEYQASFLFARARFPALYFDLMLPCTALALCYEQPGDAFAAFVQSLGTSDGKEELARRARDCYSALPRLPGNRRIGRATALRGRWDFWSSLPRYDVYNAAAATLTGAEDEFRLLTNAGAASDYAGVMRQIVLVCDDGSIPAPGRDPWVLPRLTLATLTLQTAGVARWRREAELQLGQWGGAVLRRIVPDRTSV